MLGKLFEREASARKDLLKQLPRNGVGLEVGVWKGDFSALLLKHAAPRTLHLVDPWLVSRESDRTGEAWYGSQKISQAEMDGIHQDVFSRFSQEVASGRVIVHRKTSAEAMAALPAESVDFVYIDGDHSYDAVVADLSAALRITKPRGMICCDDYMLGAWWKDGVIRAVHEFLEREPVMIHSKADSQIMIRKRETDNSPP